MMKYLLVLLTACGFTSPAEPPTGQHPTDADDVRDAPDGSGTSPRQCHVQDNTLQLCLDFEGEIGTTVDDIAKGHDGSASNVQAVQRDDRDGSVQSAAGFSGESEIDIEKTADLDIAEGLTYEMFVAMPASDSSALWPIDNYLEYGLGVQNGLMFCYANHQKLFPTQPLALGVWQHVACTYGNGQLKAYIEGARVACRNVSGAIATAANNGIVLGRNFTGKLDDIHIYASVLPADRIAAIAKVNPSVEPSGCYN